MFRLPKHRPIFRMPRISALILAGILTLILAVMPVGTVPHVALAKELYAHWQVEGAHAYLRVLRDSGEVFGTVEFRATPLPGPVPPPAESLLMPFHVPAGIQAQVYVDGKPTVWAFEYPVAFGTDEIRAPGAGIFAAQIPTTGDGDAVAVRIHFQGRPALAGHAAWGYQQPAVRGAGALLHPEAVLPLPLDADAEALAELAVEVPQGWQVLTAGGAARSEGVPVAYGHVAYRLAGGEPLVVLRDWEPRSVEAGGVTWRIHGARGVEEANHWRSRLEAVTQFYTAKYGTAPLREGELVLFADGAPSGEVLAGDDGRAVIVVPVDGTRTADPMALERLSAHLLAHVWCGQGAASEACAEGIALSYLEAQHPEAFPGLLAALADEIRRAYDAAGPVPLESAALDRPEHFTLTADVGALYWRWLEATQEPAVVRNLLATLRSVLGGDAPALAHAPFTELYRHAALRQALEPLGADSSAYLLGWLAARPVVYQVEAADARRDGAGWTLTVDVNRDGPAIGKLVLVVRREDGSVERLQIEVPRDRWRFSTTVALAGSSRPVEVSAAVDGLPMIAAAPPRAVEVAAAAETARAAAPTVSAAAAALAAAVVLLATLAATVWRRRAAGQTGH